MSTALSAAVLVMCARNSLADARRLIGDASHAQTVAHAHKPDAPATAAALRLKARSLLADARAIIASARKLYAKAMAQLARAGKLTHHYAEVIGQAAYDLDAYGRFRAVLRVEGKDVWASPRTYGKRQSAQRAALAHVRKLATSGACREVMA